MTHSSAPGTPEPGDPERGDFDDERPDSRATGSGRSRRGRLSRQPLQLAAIAVVIAAVAGAALAYRAHHRRRVVAEGLARATALLRADTYSGFREAERLLEPLVELDATEPAALRAFALAMLALDYRDAQAATVAERLLVEPRRATKVPAFAHVGHGALALARREAGTALSHTSRAGSHAWASALLARIALSAGKLDAAKDPLDRAVAGNATFPAIQALRGDVLRRTGHAGPAREAYGAALAASPRHARATYGLAKLALAGSGSPSDARDALTRLLDDRDGTPAPERARAAYHLAAIEARLGRTAESAAALDRAGVDGAARAWMERAVTEVAQGSGYRVVDGAPPAVESASDDDPWIAPPKPPPTTSISPTFRLPERPPAARTASKPATRAGSKAAPVKPTAAAKRPPKTVAKTASKSAASAKKTPTAKPAVKPARGGAAASTAKKAPASNEKARSAMERAIDAATERR